MPFNEKEFEKHLWNLYRDFLAKAAALNVTVPEQFNEANFPTDEIIVAENASLRERIAELEGQVKELQGKLSESSNAEAEAKKECEECKQRLNTFIVENGKLTKTIDEQTVVIQDYAENLERFKAENDKLKAEIPKLKKAITALSNPS